jgi:hypothetical protein
MLSMVVRIRSRMSSSSAPFPCHPLLLSLSMASSSGTRLPAGASCGSTRRILTPFHFSTNFATLPEPLFQFCRRHLGFVFVLNPLFETIDKLADRTRSLRRFPQFIQVTPASQVDPPQAFLVGALCMEFRATPLFLVPPSFPFLFNG